MVVGFPRQFRMGKETERAKAVVVGNKYDTLLGQRFSVISRFGTGARCKAAAVGKHNHRHAVGRRFRRRPDIHVETVLTCWWSCGRCGAAASPLSSLCTSRSELVGLTHAIPMRDGLRS